MAKKKKSNTGAAKPRKVPVPRTPELPSNTPQVSCHACNESIDDVRTLFAPPFRNRVCPHCGASLTEEAFDEAFREICEEQAAGDAALRRVKRSRDRVFPIIKWMRSSRVVRRAPKPIRKYVKKVLKAKDDKMNSRIASARAVVTDIGLRSRCMRVSRYYSSLWYLSSGIPLEADTSWLSYSLSLRYAAFESHCVFSLMGSSGSAEAASIAGEHEVFELLRKRTLVPDSPLFNARILPNLYLPKERGHVAAGSFWNQIDCLVLTRSCAFVIEVKRRCADVRTCRPFDHIWSNSPGKKYDKEEDLTLWDDPLGQNAKHAKLFNSLCGEYPYERIYEAVVIVGSHSFKSDCDQFVGNVYVGSMNRSKRLVGTFEDAIRENDPIMTDEEVDALADAYIDKYADRELKRWAIHVARIQDYYRSQGLLRCV